MAKKKQKPIEAPISFDVEIGLESKEVINRILASPAKLVVEHSADNTHSWSKLVGLSEDLDQELLNSLSRNHTLKQFGKTQVTYHPHRGEGLPLNIQTIKNWLLAGSFQYDYETTRKFVEKYLSEPFTELEYATCISGLNIKSKSKISEVFNLVPLSSLLKNAVFERKFPKYGGDTERAKDSTAAVLLYSAKHRSFRAGKIQRDELFRWWQRPEEEIGQVADFLVSSLCLFQKRHVATRWKMCISHSVFGQPPTSSPGNLGDIPPNQPVFENTRLFSNFARKFNSGDQEFKSLISMALIRLNRALRPERASEKVIDLGIAFEVIFLSQNEKDGTPGELTFKLAMRAAWLLGDNPEGRGKLFVRFKRLYDLRSKAVHTGTIPIEVKDADGTSQFSEDFIRICIAHCFDAVEKILKLGFVPNWQKLVLGENLNRSGN